MRRLPRVTNRVYGRGSQPRADHDSPVERDVQLDDVDPVVAEHAEGATVGVVVDHRLDLLLGQAPGRCDPLGLELGVRHRDVGVESRRRGRSRRRPGPTTSSDRSFSGPVGRRRASSTSSSRSGLSGPRFEPELDIASYPSPAADGRPWKYSALGEVLADEARSDVAAVDLHLGAVRLVVEGHLADARWRPAGRRHRRARSSRATMRMAGRIWRRIT